LELVLASASARRLEILSLLDLPFRAVGANIREVLMEGELPAEMAVRLAVAKTDAIASAHPEAMVIGCDTSVELEGEVLGKPADTLEARSMLRRLRSRHHVVHSGIALRTGETQASELADTGVLMRDYSDEEIAAYVESGDAFDKAGAYAIQHAGFHPVSQWAGCYANVMGLPLCHLVRALRVWGVNPPVDVPAVCQSYTGERCEVFSRVLCI
jgi:septum formation protein